jgi:hypothetical protein
MTPTTSPLTENTRSSAAVTRERAKRACETCKFRKRKCNSREPCSFCVRFEYECSYTTHSRRRVSRSVTGSCMVSTSAPKTLPFDRSSLYLNQRHMEANSGIAFPHVLGMNLNPSDAPRVHGFGWNLGLCSEPIDQHTNVIDLISKDEMYRLADIYFERVHPVLAFMDQETFEDKISSRWAYPTSMDSYDSVLCGVAALGSLFSETKGFEHEYDLVQCAKEVLEKTSMMRNPLLHDAAAWLLRAIYLRCNNTPHAAWMASCTTLHIMEATGAHQDITPVSILYSDTTDTSLNQESQRRLFWVAKVLNAWISYEYGRSTVVIQGVSCKPPSPRKGDVTADLISLYLISESLDPENAKEASELEDCLMRVEGLYFSHEALVLSQTNLAFTLYRRLRLTSWCVDKEIPRRIIRLGEMGIEAAVGMSKAKCPWWHVANVPFQFVCILLAIDTEESLSRVSRAISSLKIIAEQFETHSICNALETAELLVRLSRKKKERGLYVLQDNGQDEVDGSEKVSAVLPTTDNNVQGMLSDCSSKETCEWDLDAFLGAGISLFDLGPLGE